MGQLVGFNIAELIVTKVRLGLIALLAVHTAFKFTISFQLRLLIIKWRDVLRTKMRTSHALVWERSSLDDKGKSWKPGGINKLENELSFGEKKTDEDRYYELLY